MYGYSYILVSRGLYERPRSPYGFEPGEPDDLETGATRRGTLALLVAYALVVAVIVAASWTFGSDVPSATEQAKRIDTGCHRAPGLWSGCLPTK